MNSCSGKAARLQQQDAPVPGEPGIEQGRRHTSGLAGAGRGAEDHSGAPAQGTHESGENVVDR